MPTTNIDTSVTPSIGLLQQELSKIKSCGSEGQSIQGRFQTANATRYCRWDGQDPSGRKIHPDAKPWQYARDSRVRLSDEYCNYVLSLYDMADNGSILQVLGISDSDTQMASFVRKYLHWMINVRIKDNFADEMMLAKQYAVQYGWCALWTSWDMTMENESILVSAADVERKLAELGLEKPLEELDEIDADTIFQSFAGDYGWERKNFDKHLRELINKGETKISSPKPINNIPRLKALLPYKEVLVSADVNNPEDARIVFVRERLPESELWANVESRGWNKEAVRQSVESLKGVESDFFTDRNTSAHEDSSTTSYSDSDDNLIEIITAYRKATNKKNNLPVILQTVFSNHMDKYFEHSDLVEAKGKFPFCFLRYEVTNPSIYTSRGVAEILRDHQSRMKALTDITYDAVGMQTLPPVITSRNFGEVIDLTPGGHIRLSAQSSVQFLETKSKPELNMGMQDRLMFECDRLIGRANEAIPPDETMARQECHRSNFLRFKSKVVRAIWELCQTFETDEVFSRVVETQVEVPKDSIYDFALGYDARMQNLDFAEKAIDKLIALSERDSVGAFDRSKLLQFAASALSPTIASEVFVDSQQSQDIVTKQILDDVIAMYQGNPPTLRKENNLQDAGLRLQILESIVTGNPIYMQAIESGAQPFSESLRAYSENLSFALQQRQNAMIGRLGVKPPQMEGQ